MHLPRLPVLVIGLAVSSTACASSYTAYEGAATLKSSGAAATEQPSPARVDYAFCGDQGLVAKIGPSCTLFARWGASSRYGASFVIDRDQACDLPSSAAPVPVRVAAGFGEFDAGGVLSITVEGARVTDAAPIELHFRGAPAHASVSDAGDDCQALRAKRHEDRRRANESARRSTPE